MWQPRAGVEPYPLQIHCRNCADSTLRLIKCFLFVLFILFIYCGNKRNNQPNWTGKVTKSTYSNLTIWPSITRGRGLLGVVLTSWGCQMPQNTCIWHGAWHVLYLTRTIPSNSHAIRAHPLALVHANHIGPPSRMIRAAVLQGLIRSEEADEELKVSGVKSVVLLGLGGLLWNDLKQLVWGFCGSIQCWGWCIYQCSGQTIYTHLTFYLTKIWHENVKMNCWKYYKADYYFPRTYIWDQI